MRSRRKQLAGGHGDTRLPRTAIRDHERLPLSTSSRRSRTYKLGDEVNNITTPLLITDPDDEQFFPGQPQQLYDLIPGARQLIRFTAQEGASGHCEPMARSLRDTRIFDWLEGYLR